MAEGGQVGAAYPKTNGASQQIWCEERGGQEQGEVKQEIFNRRSLCRPKACSDKESTELSQHCPGSLSQGVAHAKSIHVYASHTHTHTRCGISRCGVAQSRGDLPGQGCGTAGTVGHSQPLCLSQHLPGLCLALGHGAGSESPPLTQVPGAGHIQGVQDGTRALQGRGCTGQEHQARGNTRSPPASHPSWAQAPCDRNGAKWGSDSLSPFSGSQGSAK